MSRHMLAAAEPDLHVVPENDLRDHSCSRDCWCAPTLEGTDPETGQPYLSILVIHNSADGRELVERHGVQ